MKIKNNTCLNLFIVMFLCFSLMNFKTTNAALFSVSASNNGNGTTTVTISGNCVGGFEVTYSGPTSGKISLGKTTLDSNATTVINTGAGSFTITAKAISVSDANYNPSSGQSVSTTVHVTVPNKHDNTSGGNTSYLPNTPGDNQQNIDSHKGDAEKKSADNLLSSLTLSTGTLTPEFNPEVMDYQVNLKAGTTSTNISAQAKDAKATIQGTGDKELVEGDNTFEVKVIAENGAERIYKINVYVEEKNLSIIKFDKMKYGIVTKVDRLQAPQGFEKVNLKVNGKDVPAWKNANMKLTLLYLRDEEGKSNFYIYDEKKGEVLSVYQPIQLAGKDFVQLSIVRDMQKRSGMKFSSKIKIGDLMLSGWEYEDQAYQNYVLLYLMNGEGKSNYYLYEKTEGTLQIAPEMAAISQAKFDELEKSVSSLHTWKIAGIIGTIGFALLAGISFYFNIIYKKRYLLHRRKMYELNQLDRE